mmetsp:Transcript_40130/g.45840  ORF Transcript_40130/g.45840 Transcript_40130/m.45840 type:complete len:436 (+) Transcript_40130:3-1310(+)
MNSLALGQGSSILYPAMPTMNTTTITTTTEAFDIKNNAQHLSPLIPTATMTTDTTTTSMTNRRRYVLGRIAFLAISNIVLPVTVAPAMALGTFTDDVSNSSNNRNIDGAGDGRDLSLAQPMSPSGDSRPSASLEYLLPAARVGIYIYQALAIAEDLVLSTAINTTNTEANPDIGTDIAKLDTMLLSSPPSFIKSSDPSVSRGDAYGKYSLPLISEWGVAIQKQKERKERAIDVGWAPPLFEVQELVGERRQWKQLQKAEIQREQASEIRRAFNIYTTNVNFSPTKYSWVGSSEEKRNRIRNDHLPTPTDVIRSDLDARDLYRNQIQTALDDARAEFKYQQQQQQKDYFNEKRGNGNGSDDNDNDNDNHGNDNDVNIGVLLPQHKFDATELRNILKQAQISVDKWFNFIPEHDVKLALEAVKQEEEELKESRRNVT